MRSFNIIKRLFSHHHSPTSFTKFPVSSFINHFDKEKADETNKNVQELVSKVKNIQAYLFVHFIIMNIIYMPIIIFKS